MQPNKRSWRTLVPPDSVTMRAPAQCACCRAPAPDWIWQPCGPKDAPDKHIMFEWAGGHYRGFLALHICEACKARVESHHALPFAYKSAWWVCGYTGDMIRCVTKAEAFALCGLSAEKGVT